LVICGHLWPFLCYLWTTTAIAHQENRAKMSLMGDKNIDYSEQNVRFCPLFLVYIDCWRSPRFLPHDSVGKSLGIEH
jgi:hypothetical protein